MKIFCTFPTVNISHVWFFYKTKSDEASATSLPWHPAPMELDEFERIRRDIVRSLETQTSPPGLDQTSSKFAPSPRCGASILPGLSPFRQDICFLICKRPPMYCLCALAHDGLFGLGESVSKLWILPASPGNWCATWDGDLPTDLGWIGHSWPLPSPWGRRPLLAFEVLHIALVIDMIPLHSLLRIDGGQISTIWTMLVHFH